MVVRNKQVLVLFLLSIICLSVVIFVVFMVVVIEVVFFMIEVVMSVVVVMSIVVVVVRGLYIYLRSMHVFGLLSFSNIYCLVLLLELQYSTPIITTSTITTNKTPSSPTQ